MKRATEEKVAEAVLTIILVAVIVGSGIFGVVKLFRHLLGNPCFQKTRSQAMIIDKQKQSIAGLEQYIQKLRQQKQPKQPQEKPQQTQEK